MSDIRDFAASRVIRTEANGMPVWDDAYESAAAACARYVCEECGQNLAGHMLPAVKREHDRIVGAAALAKRAESYAAKWRAEHQNAEPPVPGSPTDEALAACFAGCVRPAKPSEYEAIRLAIKGPCSHV